MAESVVDVADEFEVVKVVEVLGIGVS